MARRQWTPEELKAWNGRREARDQAFREESRLRDVEFDTRPVFTRCRSGRGWYWAVMRSFKDHCHGGEPIAEGTAPTVEEAEAAALAMAPTAYRTRAHFAAGVLRLRRARERAARTSTATGAERLEFLYHGYVSSETREVYVTPYRVVRKTGRFVYVDRESFREASSVHVQDPVSAYVELRTWRLDRAALERDGHVCHTGSGWYGGDYYVSEAALRADFEAQAEVVPECFLALGLARGASRADVKRAYKRLARQRHPDAGGNGGEFIALRSAYERALGVVPEVRP
jgi:hypothetical protein